MLYEIFSGYWNSSGIGYWLFAWYRVDVYFFLYGPIETDSPLPFKLGYTLNMTVKYMDTVYTGYRASVPNIDNVFHVLVMDRPTIAKDTSCLFDSVPL